MSSRLLWLSKELAYGTLVAGLLLGFGGLAFVGGYFTHKEHMVRPSSNSLCHDTTTQVAYIAYKGKEARCFLESREYPHRAKGSFLDDNPEDIPISGE